jgi:polar amino acid transport system substrate-binding protein
MLAAACAPQEYHADTPARYRTAANCIVSNRDNLYTTGGYAIRYLTVGTGNPALPPWWEGGTTSEHREWKPNDPYLGRGFEGAVTFEVAERLGFSPDKVRFVPIGFQKSFAPGEKDFDFALQQIPDLPERLHGVDLSEGYVDVSQALVSVPGSPIATATSLDELKDATLGVANGTVGLEYVQHAIQPRTPPTVYDDLNATVEGLENGDVQGIVVDLPSASSITRARLPDGVIVGRLPTAGSPEQFAMAFEKGSPIVQCVNLALEEMEADGTLAEIRRAWLPDTANAPMIAG